MEKKIIYLVLGIILIFSLYLRLSGTLSGMFAFTYDQGRDFLTLKKMVDDKDLSLIGPPTGIDGVFHGVWWHYLLLPMFYISDGNPQVVVGLFNILSTSAILLAFYLGRKLIDDRFGLILALITAISPFFIGKSTQLWHPHVVPILMFFLLIAVWQNLKGKWSYIWIASSLGLIFEFEFGFGGLFLPAFFLAALIFKILPKQKEIIWSTTTFGIWFIPRLLFELRHNFLQTKAFFSYLTLNQAVHVKSTLEQRVIDRTVTVFKMLNDAYARNFILLFVFLLLVTIWVWLKSTKSKELNLLRKYFLFLLLISLFLILAATIYGDTLWGYYLVGLPVLYLPLFAFAFWIILKRNLLFGKLAIIVYSLLLIAPWNFFWPKPWAGDASVYKNQMIVVESIYQEAKSTPFNVAVYSPSVIDYNYQYLFSWYGKRKYGYVPDRVKILPLVFFIVEPDPWDKGFRELWLKEREGDGVTTKEYKIPGEIIVQKRERKVN